MIKNFLKRGFWPRLVMGLIFLLEFILLVFVIWLFASSALASALALPFLLLVFVYGLVLMAYIVNTKVPDAYKISWLFIVGALPFFGSVFYFVFANKKPTRKSQKLLKKFTEVFHNDLSLPETENRLAAYHPEAIGIARYLQNSSHSGIYENTDVTYFPLGDSAYPVILSELKKAKHYIFMQYFILAPGVFLDSVLNILYQKVKEGVDVRILYDDFGCFSTLPVGFDEELRKKGIKCYAFNKFHPTLNVRMNNRDHRKILVIDGHTSFTGGINVADEYINRKKRFGHWKDNCVMLKGQGTYGLTLMFLAAYQVVIGRDKKIDFDYYRPVTFIDEIGGFPPTRGFVAPYADYPSSGEPVGERLYVSLCQKSRNYVYCATPYLLIDSELRNALCQAADEGKDVRILLPGIPDKKLVYQLTLYNCGPLLEHGVRIYTYTHGFVHEKTFLVDDKMGSVGTINLDYRSLYLHFENGVYMVGCPALSSIKRDFLDTFALSHEMSLEEWKKEHRGKKIALGLLSLFSPFL